MSLINDALKKARQAQQQNPSPLAAQQFRPVESERRRSNLFFLLPVAIVLLSAAGGALVWAALQKSGAIRPEPILARQSQPETQPAPLPAAQPTTPTGPQTIATAPIPAPAAPGTHAGSNNQAGTSSVETVAVQAAPAAPVFPVLRGIFYNPNRPSAVLNNRTVFVGDRIGGFRVLAIAVDRVTVEGAGQTNVLTLPE